VDERARDLSALVRDPASISRVSRDSVPELLATLESVRARLWLRLSEPSRPERQGRPSPVPDRLLEAEEAARVMGVKKRWLYEHADELPFTVRVGRLVRFSEQRLYKWMATR